MSTSRCGTRKRKGPSRSGSILGKPLKGSGGLSEIVIDSGPGYRLYYCRESAKMYWFLLGGIKNNQVQDIKQAKEIHKDLKRSGYGKAD